MTALAGIVARRSRDALRRACASSIDGQSLYWREPPRFVSIDGACFSAALFPTTQEELRDQQPLSARETLVVADARIDNRGDLISVLADARVTAASSDSDLILAGWSKWGHGLLDRVIGSFALAIFDSTSRRVILARGPIGDRPLCYRLSTDSLAFASMPSGLTGGGPFCPDLSALARSIVLGDMTLGETAFADVRTVPPGHFLEWSEGRQRLVRFWNAPPVDQGRTGDIIGEFRHLLDQAVASRLRRIGGPVASHLSSGFDSSAVTATAAILSPSARDVIAFTMGPGLGLPLRVPRGKLADETALAAETAANLAIEHRIIRHSGPLLDCLKGHGRLHQGPVPNVPNHGWGDAIDQAAAGAGARVLLSAGMGNASVSYGGVHLLSDWLRRGHYAEYFREARALVRRGEARWRGAILYPSGHLFPRNLWNRLAGLRPRSPAEMFIQPWWWDKVSGDQIGSSYNTAGLRQDQYQIYSRSDPGLFTKGVLARSGLDERDPTADPRLIEFCLTLPAEHYLHDGVTKRLAREGLADRLPPSILSNRVRGYQGADWFAKLHPRSAMEWLEEIAASPSADQLLDIRRLRRTIESWDRVSLIMPAPQRQLGIRFTRALAVGAFLREMETDFGRLGRRA